MRRVILGLAAAALIASFGAVAASAQAGVTWLCEPGLESNPCEIPQDTTIRSDDRPDHVSEPSPPVPPRVDCFYVYPTVSNQPTPNADKSRDPELESIAKYQASRFSQQCRVFAPIYRQGTLAGITGALSGGDRSFDAELAYGDVLEAWRTYLRKENDGRGVVLIGHSQGSFMLKSLIADEIERKPAQERRIVSALLLGGNVEVPKGKPVGGDFASTPLCKKLDQVGCVVAYSTFAEDPPEGAFFGTATDRGRRVACTDPRELAGTDKPLRLLVPSEPFAPGAIAAGNLVTSGGSLPTAETTWVVPGDRYDASCRTVNGAHVLRLEPQPGSRTPGSFPEPGWGTHLIDVNVTLEPLVKLVTGQADRWTDPRLRLKCHRGVAGGMRLRVGGRDAELARSATFRYGHKRIARDRSLPFKARVSRERLRRSGGRRVRVELKMAYGEARRVKMRRQSC